jgi:NADPH-dependent 7-cyano-7-deazaguanine reductase QueF
MQIEYKFEAECRCPVDKLPDVYLVTLLTSRVIPVESILLALVELREEEIFQEEFTQRLHRILNCKVVSEGSHSGITTRVSV